MIKRYQSTWNIWSTCTNTLCYQLKYFLFLFGFTLLAARYDLFLTGTAILSSDNTTLAGMRQSCGQSCHLNRDEKEVGGHWSGPGGKVNPTVSYGPEHHCWGRIGMHCTPRGLPPTYFQAKTWSSCHMRKIEIHQNIISNTKHWDKNWRCDSQLVTCKDCKERYCWR